MSEWISVKDRLPNEDDYVVAAHMYYYGTKPDACVCSFFNGSFYIELDGLEASNHDGGAVITMNFNPTHWMPLPEPPKAP